ncbi:hypothetical protein D7X32_24880 [Corallococcus carmarthensis]|uniref:Uncharacterized protein n=1 Tax=Corallococcus carmarthensis TaxID=2316728 RepID=A0A3A8K738_9BACT|nr:hypothetical protein D7X32_24880 [Corallococcus carmarthensis]
MLWELKDGRREALLGEFTHAHNMIAPCEAVAGLPPMGGVFGYTEDEEDNSSEIASVDLQALITCQCVLDRARHPFPIESTSGTMLASPPHRHARTCGFVSQVDTYLRLLTHSQANVVSGVLPCLDLLLTDLNAKSRGLPQQLAERTRRWTLDEREVDASALLALDA